MTGLEIRLLCHLPKILGQIKTAHLTFANFWPINHCFNCQVLSQRFLQSMDISSYGNKDEESEQLRGTEIAAITVLSKYDTAD